MKDPAPIDDEDNNAPPPQVRIARTPALATLAVVAGLLVFLYLVRQALTPFVVGGIVAFVASPLIDRLCRRTRLPRFVWAIALLAVFGAVFALVVVEAGPPLLAQALEIGGDLHGMVARFARVFIGERTFTLFGTKIDAALIGAAVENGLQGWVSGQGNVFAILAAGFAVIVGFIVTFVVTGYLLYDAPGIAGDLVDLAPPAYRAFVRDVLVDLVPILRRYFIGMALVVFYATVVAYVGLGWILGIRHATFLALLTGVFEVVPIVGPAASAIIAGLVAVQQTVRTWDVAAYLIYAVTLRVSIDQLVSPIVLGRAAYIRPVLVIFCFLSGGLLFGVVGIILAVPVAVAIKVALARLYEQGETGKA